MLVPAPAAAGPVLTIERSALVETIVVTVELLLPGVASVVVEATFAVLVRLVPEEVEGEMCTTMVKVALAPAVSVAMLQETVAPVVQVNVGPVVCVSETKVVLAGSVSVHATFSAFEGPALATVMV